MAAYNEQIMVENSKETVPGSITVAELTDIELLTQAETEMTKAATETSATSITGLSHDEHPEAPPAPPAPPFHQLPNATPLTPENLTLHNSTNTLDPTQEVPEEQAEAQDEPQGQFTHHLEHLRAVLYSVDAELPETLLGTAAFDRYAAAEQLLPFERFLATGFFETITEGGNYMYPTELDEEDLAL